MTQIDFAFRSEILNKHISSTVSYCYQCTSCTSACPVSQITNGDYNPRKIIMNALTGLKEKLLVEKDPNVWDCTQCCTCDEICPQHVKLTEIFAYIKNQFAERHKAPEGFLSEAEVVYNNGKSVPLQTAIQRRRDSLNLPNIPEPNYDELKEIMDLAGLGELVKNPNENTSSEGGSN